MIPRPYKSRAAAHHVRHRRAHLLLQQAAIFTEEADVGWVELQSPFELALRRVWKPAALWQGSFAFSRAL